MMVTLLNGDCLEQMKQLPDNSADSIVTDPPYGISFMAKKWDYDVPKVKVWKEAMRVLKPGGHALIACGTRTQHRMVVNIEDAGFEIRDVVSWIYGSGFPKSLNIHKKDERCPEGWGTALKPTCEFFTLARKPLSEKTVAKNVLKWGTGGINIDGCRVESSGDVAKTSSSHSTQQEGWDRPWRS
jgi:site-specific DNA-methyltransferase (adenine-specific)